MIRYLLTTVLIIATLILIITIAGFLLNTILTLDSLTHYSVSYTNATGRFIGIS
jgi:hypothetical protein